MKDKIKNLVFILILGTVSAGSLLSLRAYTQPIIEKYQAMVVKSSILGAAGVAYEFNETSVDKAFSENIKEEGEGESKYYISPTNDYVFEFVGRGLWGMIEGVITLDPDLETIKVVKIISQEETPGLGSRIAEEPYLTALTGKKVAPELVLVSRKKADTDTEVDAITGATISSKALIDALNVSIEDFQKARGK